MLCPARSLGARRLNRIAILGGFCWSQRGPCGHGVSRSYLPTQLSHHSEGAPSSSKADSRIVCGQTRAGGIYLRTNGRERTWAGVMRPRTKLLAGMAWTRERLDCSVCSVHVQIRAADTENMNICARRIDPGAVSAQTPQRNAGVSSWRDCEQREPFRARTSSACPPLRKDRWRLAGRFSTHVPRQRRGGFALRGLTAQRGRRRGGVTLLLCIMLLSRRDMRPIPEPGHRYKMRH
ncbi:hypothetical protein BD309DRAFT_722641 [Dichomitus squalens]|nr:hypothetical protein BD309DRAFT_722641 [Dichomitus squalens]